MLFISQHPPTDISQAPAGRVDETGIENLGAMLANRADIAGPGSENHAKTLDCDPGSQGPALENVLQSTLWGIGRSVAAEYPEMRVVRLDLDPSRETTG